MAFLEQTKAYGSVPGLDSIRNLMHELQDVQEQLAIVHIAGTNGKGSVGAMVERVLREAGYRTGRFVSPAVFSYREIIQCNGEPISEQDFAELTGRVQAVCEHLTKRGLPHPTAFEVETAIAFLYFVQSDCELVLLEVGMGGRLDATNLIQSPVCSVITTISMDHMAFLGDNLAAIAAEKAGIIKAHCPVVSACQKAEAAEVLGKRAKSLHAKLFFAREEQMTEVSYDCRGLSFLWRGTAKLWIPLTGAAQLHNAACALEALEVLSRHCGYRRISEEIVAAGLRKVRWEGRFELISEEPTVILDGAHNEDAALALRQTLENCFTNRRILYIIGVLADKEHEKILRIMLPLADRVYTVTPDSERALPAEALAAEAKKYHSGVQAMEQVADAVRRALQESEPDDVILAFGSLSYLKEVKEAFRDLQQHEH